MAKKKPQVSTDPAELSTLSRSLLADTDLVAAARLVVELDADDDAPSDLLWNAIAALGKSLASLKKHTKKVKTIKFSELQHLSFCNSPKLPSRVVVGGVVKEWVGIGWISLDDKPTKDDVVVVE